MKITRQWKVAFPLSLSRNFYVRTHLNFTRVKKIEAVNDRPRVKVIRDL